MKDSQGRELLVRWIGHAGHVELWSPRGTQAEDRVRDAGLFLAYIHSTALLPASPPRPRHPEDPETVQQTEEADYFVENPEEPVANPNAWDPATNATYPPSAYTRGNFRLS